MTSPHARVRAAVRAASQGLVDRELLVELTVLGAIANEHVLVVGPPGTAKSEAVRRVARAFGAKTFDALLGRFTEPSELVGPVDLRRLREGALETVTEGMLPEAEFAFLDEVFLGSTAILNTLLSILHERTFRRGRTSRTVPLRVCVAASNALPDDESLAAFADRFLVRAFVEPVADSLLETLLQAGRARTVATAEVASIADLDTLAQAANRCDVAGVRSSLAEVVRVLRQRGISLSDRRIVKLQQLVAAAAVLDGRERADARDLWPIVYAVPTFEQQRVARSVLAPLLAESANSALAHAAVDASQAAAARAAKLTHSARALLDEASSDDQATRQTQLRAEALLREIDATIPRELSDAALSAVRAELARRLA